MIILKPPSSSSSRVTQRLNCPDVGFARDRGIPQQQQQERHKTNGKRKGSPSSKRESIGNSKATTDDCCCSDDVTVGTEESSICGTTVDTTRSSSIESLLGEDTSTVVSDDYNQTQFSSIETAVVSPQVIDHQRPKRHVHFTLSNEDAIVTEYYDPEYPLSAQLIAAVWYSRLELQMMVLYTKKDAMRIIQKQKQQQQNQHYGNNDKRYYCDDEDNEEFQYIQSFQSIYDACITSSAPTSHTVEYWESKFANEMAVLLRNMQHRGLESLLFADLIIQHRKQYVKRIITNIPSAALSLLSVEEMLCRLSQQQTQRDCIRAYLFGLIDASNTDSE